MKPILILFTILPILTFSQTAKFYADSTDLWHHVGRVKPEYDEIVNEMEWRIDGKTFCFGSAPVEVNADPNKIDTLFYKQNNRRGWDTLICNVRKPQTYRFIYNSCCNSFFTADDEGIVWGKVSFQIKGGDPKKVYVGALDDDQVLVTPAAVDTLERWCRSVLLSNVYQITLSEIELCNDRVNCEEGYCLHERDKNPHENGFYYRNEALKFTISDFLTLDWDPVRIVYDAGKDKYTIR